METSVLERFFSYVMPVPWSGCHEWLGPLARDRAVLRIGLKRPYTAARVAYEIEHGSIPPGKWICHRCDNASCVNPAHLYAGTPSDNMKDRVKRGKPYSRQTHCKRGHEQNAENVYINHGKRYCRGCACEHGRIKYRRKKAAREAAA